MSDAEIGLVGYETGGGGGGGGGVGITDGYTVG